MFILKNITYIVFFILISLNSPAQWIQLDGILGGDVRSITALNSKIFAAYYEGGIYSSTNNGLNWNYSGLSNRILYSLINNGVYVFAGASTGVFRSTDNGLNWNSLSGGAPLASVYAFTTSGSNIFAGVNNLILDPAVYKSTNSGINWTPANLTNQTVTALTTLNTNLFAGTYNGIFLSTNLGQNWITVNNGLSNYTIRALAVSGINIYAGTNSGIYISTNNGLNWNNISNEFTSQSILSVITYDSSVFVGTYSNGIYMTSNNGNNWIQKNQGFSQIYHFKALYIYSNYIFAGTSGASVWRRSLSEIIGIQPISSIVPDKFSLSQNYPNPFNPTTNIKYQIKNNSFVTLKVYDILGKEIATLVNEKLKPGEYESTFDGSSFSSGIYFYRLTCGDFTQTNRMVLIK